MTTPTLHTQRLTLRGPELSDAHLLADFYQSPRCQWIGGPLPRAEAGALILKDIVGWDMDGHGMWTITQTDTGQPIGRTGIMVNPDWHEPELAWHLFDGFEGHGYACEATHAARAHCQTVLNMPPLISGIHLNNHRSIALALRLGAVLESTTPLFGDTYHLYRHPGAIA